MLTQEQQLQLPAGILLVSPQLPLDLLADPLVLSLLRRHATPGHGPTSPPEPPAVGAAQPHLLPGSEITEGRRHGASFTPKIETPSSNGNGGEMTVFFLFFFKVRLRWFNR